jgi:hypothetical protein
MKITAFKRLVKEDFDVDQQPLIEKLATVFNLFQEQVYSGFNNNITLAENLSAMTTSITIKVDALGQPITSGQIKYTLKSRLSGAQVLSATSRDNSLLAGAPFLVYSLSGNIITIKQITGLLPNVEYNLSIVFYGS